MPASPQVEMTYREDYYEGHAEDGASIISTDALAKVYARGVGVVLEITVSGGSDRDELLSYHEG